MADLSGDLPPDKRQEGRVVYCKFYRNRKTGQLVYPKRGTCFRFVIKDK